MTTPPSSSLSALREENEQLISSECIDDDGARLHRTHFKALSSHCDLKKLVVDTMSGSDSKELRSVLFADAPLTKASVDYARRGIMRLFHPDKNRGEEQVYESRSKMLSSFFDSLAQGCKDVEEDDDLEDEDLQDEEDPDDGEFIDHDFEEEDSDEENEDSDLEEDEDFEVDLEVACGSKRRHDADHVLAHRKHFSALRDKTNVKEQVLRALAERSLEKQHVALRKLLFSDCLLSQHAIDGTRRKVLALFHSDKNVGDSKKHDELFKTLCTFFDGLRPGRVRNRRR